VQSLVLFFWGWGGIKNLTAFLKKKKKERKKKKDIYYIICFVSNSIVNILKAVKVMTSGNVKILCSQS
jgi:hypothetical protein